LLTSNSSGFAGGSIFGIDTSGGSLSYSFKIVGNIGLTKLGGNSLVLTASNTYSGATTVTQGKLVVDGTLTNSNVSVSGGRLGGSGNLKNVIVNAGGTVAPGDSPGVMHLSGNLTLMASAAMDFVLDGNPADDEISLPSGTLSLNNQQFSDFSFTPL